jgi:hypothetical protein
MEFAGGGEVISSLSGVVHKLGKVDAKIVEKVSHYVHRAGYAVAGGGG